MVKLYFPVRQLLQFFTRIEQRQALKLKFSYTFRSMDSEPRYRTYLIRLWLFLFLIPPLSILIIFKTADESLLLNESNPLQFVIDLQIVILFFIPVVLFFLFISAFLTRIFSEKRKFRILTIVLMIIGLIITTLFVTTLSIYNTEQILYGVFFLLLYFVSIITCGLKFPL